MLHRLLSLVILVAIGACVGYATAGSRGAQRLHGVKLAGASLPGLRLPRADLSLADFSGANLSAADFHGACLRSADLSQAILSGADLREADLRNADLRDARLKLARLAGANLRGARYDHSTAWPDGFNPGTAGAIDSSPIGPATTKSIHQLTKSLPPLPSWYTSTSRAVMIAPSVD